MKDKKNPLEKFLDRTIVFTFKQLGELIIISLGIGALISLLSLEAGIILAVLMFLVLLIILLPYVITFKGAP